MRKRLRRRKRPIEKRQPFRVSGREVFLPEIAGTPRARKKRGERAFCPFGKRFCQKKKRVRRKKKRAKGVAKTTIA